MPSRQYLPESDRAKFNNYAESLDVSGNYMVVGASYNDSLELDAGIAYVYFLNANEKWGKIATLAPSDIQQSLNFGAHVSISQNTIGILGFAYDEKGTSTAKIYMYERPINGTWSSSTETYQLTNTENSIEFEFNLNELVVLSNGYSRQDELKIFQKSSGVYSLNQTINLPLDKYGYSGNARHLNVEDGVIALGADQFTNTDNKTGVAFIYQKSGSLYGSIPAATLRPTDYTIYDWIGFGSDVFIYNKTVFVLASSIYQIDGTFKSGVYIFEKPLSGWTDAAVSAHLTGDSYIGIECEIIADNNFVMVAGFPWNQVQGFKKTTNGWTGAEPFQIIPPLKGISFGKHLNITNHHLIIGSPSLFADRNLGGDEVVVDYFSSNSDWLSLSTPNQIITESSFNASGDFFGAEMATNETQLFVGAPRDSELGLANGCVYVFDIDSPENSKPVKLLSPQPQIDSGFGYGLASGDSLLFVSAIFQDSIIGNGNQPLYTIGKVFVYRLTNSGWTNTSQIVAPEIKANASFGQDIAYHNGYIAISEYYVGSSESDGRVHIYKIGNTGQFQFLATLRPSEDIRGDFFGRSIIMNDSLIVVATGNTEFNVDFQMKVFIYKKKGEWANTTEDARLLSSDKKWSDLFGFSIAMDDDYIVVGAPSAPGFNPAPVPRTETSKGAAYIFKRPRGGWKGTIYEIAKLLPSDPVDYAFFGTSVGIDHDDIFIGAPHSVFNYNVIDHFVNPNGKILPGKVYHYKKSGKEWVSTNQEKRQLQSFEPDWLDGYGYTLIISDRYLYTSVLLDDTEVGFQSGSVQTVMQLPIIRGIDTLCVAGAPIQLKGFPKRNGIWSGAGVDTMTGLFNPSISGPGNHPIRYVVSGCESMDTVTVVDYDFEIISKSPNSQIKCVDSSIEINLQSNLDPSQYMWFYRESDQNPFQKYDSLKSLINVDRPGLYKAEISYKFCPTLKEEFNVEDELPINVVVVGPHPIICSDDPIQLQASPSGGGWSGDGISQTGIIDPTQQLNGVITVAYIYTSEIGCISSEETQVEIDKLDDPIITQSGTEVCVNNPVTFQLEQVDAKTSVQWYNELNSANAIGDDLNFSVTTKGSFFATVTKHHCSKISPTVTVIEKVDTLFVPNVFTPNADGSNEYFEIKGKNLDDFTLIILNRYGQRVYESKNSDFNWDAENISSGVYFWRITYMNCGQTSKEFNGWVQIVR